MALESARKKVAQARKDYEKQLKVVGKELRNAIIASIAEALPEGWVLAWNQSDHEYNDQDYYFGVNSVQLVSEREPRQGEMTNPGRPRKVESKTDNSWGYPRTIDVVTDYGEEPEYEWHLDAKCPKRDWLATDEIYEGCPGVLLVDGHETGFGLTKKDLKPVWDAWDDLSENDVRSAFGDSASIRIHKNGKCIINENEDEE